MATYYARFIILVYTGIYIFFQIYR